jgi:uncharacterized phage protein (TIGR01671 family)
MNSDTIKFRAWHKSEKKMCEVSLINFGNKTAFLLGITPVKDTVTENGRFIIVAPTEGRNVNFDEIELMQYSGVMDSLGNEIYENDLIELAPKGMGFIHGHMDIEGVATIKKCTGEWRFFTEDNKTISLIEFLAKGFSCYIVGNTHQKTITHDS